MLFEKNEKTKYEDNKIDNKYELYHDESIKDGYWHGMLLIPTHKKVEFYEVLQCYRKKIAYYNKFSFKDIKGPGQKFDLADAWLNVGIGFLRSGLNSEKYPVYSWNDNSLFSKFEVLPPEFLGAKFILFRVKGEHEDMTYFSDKVCNIETTMRMGLKGGLHYLGTDINPIFIEKIHLDGYEHYLRHADVSRIVDRIYGLRDYCSFAQRDKILDDRSSDPQKSDHQEIIDCEFLVLTDLLIGSFRVALSQEKNQWKKKLSEHAKLILKRLSDGRKRMSNSRWCGSFCLSECELVDNKWKFNNLELEIPIADSAQESFGWDG